MYFQMIILFIKGKHLQIYLALYVKSSCHLNQTQKNFWMKSNADKKITQKTRLTFAKKYFDHP